MISSPRQRHLIEEIVRAVFTCYRRVEREICKWRQKKDELYFRNIEFRKGLSSELRGTVGRLDPFILTELLDASSHVDKAYIQDLLNGFPVTGEVPCHGTGTPIPGGGRVHGQPGDGQTPSLQSLLSQAASSDEQGSVLGTGQSLSSLARILGPLLGMPLLGQSASLPYFLGAVLILSGGALILRMPGKRSTMQTGYGDRQK